MAIIDDTAFVGDIHNFVSKDQPGIMVKLNDPSLVEGLADIHRAAERGRGGQDYEVVATDGTSLMVDAGNLGESLILNRAGLMVDSAQQSVRITSQHTPDGKILKNLQAAQDRGVAVSAFVADPRKVTRPLSRFFDTRSQLLFKRQGFTTPVFEFPGWIHSNVLLIDEDLPSAVSIVGTRCFSGTLADWGTQEVALQSQNPGLLQQLQEYVQTLNDVAIQRKPERSIKEIVLFK